ncbi:transposase [Xanthomonas oryzae]|uniref:transposase n=5 Tax=Xanthomonas oryzae TaxID=347 RepID=UPI000AADDE10
MKKRFSEEQIIDFLREAEAGMPIKDLCHRHGFSEASYYLWRSKFGGMRVHDVSSANVHDRRHFERLLDAGNTARTIRVDGAYADQDREARLKEEGYRVVQHKGTRGNPLSLAQQRRNQRIAKDRVFVEHAFARLTHQGGKCLPTHARFGTCEGGDRVEGCRPSPAASGAIAACRDAADMNAANRKSASRVASAS